MGLGDRTYKLLTGGLVAAMAFCTLTCHQPTLYPSSPSQKSDLEVIIEVGEPIEAYVENGKLGVTESIHDAMCPIKAEVKPVDKKEEDKWDPLAFDVFKYLVMDMFNQDSPLDDKVEDKLGIRILGEPTQQDLNDLVEFYEKGKDLLYIKRDVGIKYVAIFPASFLEKIDDDYWGLADHANHTVRLFSGIFAKHHIHTHEWTHFATKYLEKIEEDRPNIIKRWKDVAGEYNKVHKVEGYTRYKFDPDPTNNPIRGPKYGYASPYGGTNEWEDMSEFAEKVAKYPDMFKRVDSYFDTYEAKLGLLHDTLKRIGLPPLITDEQFAIAKASLQEARAAHREEMEVRQVCF